MSGARQVKILFDEIAPTQKERNGGYTRIARMPFRRQGDAAEVAILEFVDVPIMEAPAAEAPAAETKKASKKKSEGEAAPATA